MISDALKPLHIIIKGSRSIEKNVLFHFDMFKAACLQMSQNISIKLNMRKMY
jgi:hypothetical protein